MNWVTVKFSPEAKHALKWVHTWLGMAAAAAPLAYENLDTVKEFVNPHAVPYITAALVLTMIYNTMRAKKK